MWGLLGSSKEGAQEAAPPDTTPVAPPPMMFNPQNTTSTIKSRTSRNPLSRPKRPAASGQVINQAQLQNQPLSPTGQAVSPHGEGQVQAQSPVSPSALPSFNAFPNFQSSDNHNLAAEHPNNQPPSTEQVNQYLSNYDYGVAAVGQVNENAPVDSNQINNSIHPPQENHHHQMDQHTQNQQYPQDGQYQQNNQYDQQQHQYQPHQNQVEQQNEHQPGYYQETVGTSTSNPRIITNISNKMACLVICRAPITSTTKRSLEMDHNTISKVQLQTKPNSRYKQ
ncbi:uncharacterized protein LOC134821260 [Bolinopsis microptera]|uniref:uncharacterized protein LOC134821260 n=1 Tax=Bolinopsis microptera TaxID=2820187 RepID=UPI0030796E8D